MSAASDFKGDYAPGGLTSRAKRRAMARRGGLASGRKRRALARGRRVSHRRTRDEALNLAYRNRQVTRQEFERIYRRVRPAGNAAGLQTAWDHYVTLFTRYRREGQHYRTTNQQRSAALTTRGRARCRRTVQRLNRLMADMGLATVSHYRNGRDAPGRRDCLVVEIRSARSKNVTPPTGAGTPVPGVVPALPESERRAPEKRQGRAAPAQVAPPSAAETIEPASPAVSEREECEAAIRFLEHKRRLGFGDPARIRFRLRELEHRRDAARGAPASPPAPRPGSGDPHTAP